MRENRQNKLEVAAKKIINRRVIRVRSGSVQLQSTAFGYNQQCACLLIRTPKIRYPQFTYPCPYHASNGDCLSWNRPKISTDKLIKDTIQALNVVEQFIDEALIEQKNKGIRCVHYGEMAYPELKYKLGHGRVGNFHH